MKSGLLRTLVPGVLMLTIVGGSVVAGTTLAGASTSHEIGGKLTFSAGGTVKCNATYVATTKGTWDTASWNGSGTSGTPYADVASTSIGCKTTLGNSASITDSAGGNISVVKGTSITFDSSVRFVITKDGTTCKISLGKSAVFDHVSGTKYTPGVVSTAGASVSTSSGTGAICKTITTSLQQTGSDFSGQLSFT